jgi:hypothetical protein
MYGAPLPLQPPAFNPPFCKLHIPAGWPVSVAPLKELSMSGTTAKPLMKSL